MKKTNLTLVLAITTVVVLLILSHLFLFRPGFWYLQDAGYWPKNSYEVYLLITQQLTAFTNTGYYPGFDQGLLGFTRISYISLMAILFSIFGYEGSQVLFSLLGTILVFVSMYYCLKIFFTDSTTKFFLALFYTFNPLTYSLQGSAFYNAAIPLFLYSYYQYFYGEKKIRFWFLLLNCLAGFIWVAYIRFFAIDFIVIAIFLAYFFVIHGKRLPIKKLLLFVGAYLLVFSPILFSFIAQIFSKSVTAFNYGAVLGKFVATDSFYNAFTIFQSSGADLYHGMIWSIIGLCFFVVFFFLLTISAKKIEKKGLMLLCIALLLFSVFSFSIGNLFSEQTYFLLRTFLPYVTNSPFWAHYILFFPLTILLGLLLEHHKRVVIGYIIVFIGLAVFPLLQLSDFQLQKFRLETIPEPYYEAFIKPHSGFPEATYFAYGICWRAEYMNSANVPTLCPNWGLTYSTAFLADPRLTSGISYDIAKIERGFTDTDNLRITHNLKNIIIPLDIVERRGPGPLTSEKEIAVMNESRKVFETNKLLVNKSNSNFSHFYYRDKDDFDYYLYAPKSIISQEDTKVLTDNSINLAERPVILSPDTMVASESAQGGKVSLKMSPVNPTMNFAEISEIDISRPLLLQFNQSFSRDWKVVFLTEEDFDARQCRTEITTYVLSGTARCQLREDFAVLQDLSLLTKQSIAEDRHVAGNVIGNTWIVQPAELQVHAQNGKLWIGVIYAKQIYYSSVIAISIISLFILTCLSIIQTVRQSLRKKQ